MKYTSPFSNVRLALILAGLLILLGLAYALSPLTRPTKVTTPTTSPTPGLLAKATHLLTKTFEIRGNEEREREEKEEDEGDDPDMPGFMRGRKIDKEAYLRGRSEEIARMRGYEPGQEFDPSRRVRALRMLEQQQRRQRTLEATTLNWTQVGPAPIPNGQTLTSVTAVSGRVTAIAVHPTDPNKVYVGTAAGGVYRSLNGGTTWAAIMDTAASLTIGALTIDPATTTTLWVGTGEPNTAGDSLDGVGIYRITNAESSPTLQGPFSTRVAGCGTGASTGIAFDRTGISKIVFDPNDSTRMFVGNEIAGAGIGGTGFSTGGVAGFIGIFLCANAQATTPTFSRCSAIGGGATAVKDIAFEPGSSSNLLLSAIDRTGGTGSGIYRITNANTATVTPSASFTATQVITLAAFSNSALAINKVGATVTVIANTSTSNGRVLKSTDGGATFPTTLTTANGFCGGQCFYDMPVGIDPTDANKIYIGGAADGASTRIFARATDGSTFASSAGGLHADAHAIAVAPSNTAIVYFGNDGGIYKSTDSGATWASLNNTGFSATQFMGLATHPTDREFMIGGTQDNGTNFKKPDGTWTRADFGDGGYAVIDQNAADTTNVRMYHTYFNSLSAGLVGYATVATIATASDGNWGFRGCNGVTGNGINCNDTAVRFYAPLVSGPGNPNPIYFGTDRLYRSTDNGTTHTVVSQAPLVSGQAITAIGIASNDDNVRAVGLANGKVYRTTNGSSTLTDVTGTIPARFVSRIVVDPNDNNIAYVTLAAYTATGTITTGQNVWKTTNFLAGTPTWAVSGSGIPDVPVNAFAIDPTNSATLYAGTDIGVYYSTNSGTSWTVLSTGLPRVPVFDLKFQGASSLRLLRAATHGRGIWELKVGCPTVTMSPSTLPNGASNTMYSQQLSASGDVGPYTFAQTGGTLPPGLMLSSSGLLSGTPTTSGSYTFTVTATSSDTCPGSQMYTVVIDCPTANAGPDQNLCNVNAATMAGNTPSSGSGAWSQISGPNTATITTASLPTTTMTGLIAGTYAFRWMISSGTCTASTDDVAVTIAPLPTAANAGSDQTLCTTSAATLAANSPASGTGAWSVVSGPSTLAAQFSSTSANNATFTPVGGAGTYTLRWTISNATCTASTDDVALNYSAPPTAANAGPDQNLCITSAATLAANNPSVGTGVWSVVSGPSTLTAQFSSTSARNATFTPAGGAGTYTLRWTISSSPCTVATDDVVLNYSAQPTTANAGPDQTLCGTTPATLAANAPGVGTGAWSVVSGPSTLTSQFSNTGANNATFAPAGGSGNYTLRWTITNGACTSTDDVTLNYNAAPLVTTNPTNQSVAPGGTATFTVAASGIPTPTVQWQVSTDMGATFTNIPGATNTTLSFPVTGADNGKKYRAVFTNSCNPPATTTAAMLTTGTTPPLIVQAGGRPNNVGVNIGDPAVCIDPAGIVGIEAMLTNTGNTPQISSFTATLPAGLTAIAGTCFATSINPGVCTIAGNGGSVSWNGQLNAGETLSVVYRARIGATVAQGTQFCIGNAGTVGGIPANLQYCFTISCPLTDTRVSDQKAGSVVVFPYYASTIGGASDTRLTLSNISNSAGTTNVHLFFIDGISCQPADVFLCLTPNASFSFKASDYDPGNTGYLIAVVVNAQGVPIQNNVLIGNAFVNTPTFLDNYGAESFWANSPAVATVDGTNATLYFDQVGYDAVPKQFTVEIQSPLDAIGQQVITAALNGNLITSQMSGAAQVGTGLAFNEKEVFTSFSAWLAGTCQARGIISTNSPRVPNGLGNLIKTGQAGTLKFNVGAAVGLLMTPRTATWKGIRTLHKTQTGATTLIIPIFAPVC